MSGKFKKQLQELETLMKCYEQVRRETRMEQARQRATGNTKLSGLLDIAKSYLNEPYRNNDIRLNASVRNPLRNNMDKPKGKKIDILEGIELLKFA